MKNTILIISSIISLTAFVIVLLVIVKTIPLTSGGGKRKTHPPQPSPYQSPQPSQPPLPPPPPPPPPPLPSSPQILPECPNPTGPPYNEDCCYNSFINQNSSFNFQPEINDQCNTTADCGDLKCVKTAKNTNLCVPEFINNDDCTKIVNIGPGNGMETVGPFYHFGLDNKNIEKLEGCLQKNNWTKAEGSEEGTGDYEVWQYPPGFSPTLFKHPYTQEAIDAVKKLSKNCNIYLPDNYDFKSIAPGVPTIRMPNGKNPSDFYSYSDGEAGLWNCGTPPNPAPVASSTYNNWCKTHRTIPQPTDIWPTYFTTET